MAVELRITGLAPAMDIIRKTTRNLPSGTLRLNVLTVAAAEVRPIHELQGAPNFSTTEYRDQQIVRAMTTLPQDRAEAIRDNLRMIEAQRVGSEKLSGVNISWINHGLTDDEINPVT